RHQPVRHRLRVGRSPPVSRPPLVHKTLSHRAPHRSADRPGRAPGFRDRRPLGQRPPFRAPHRPPRAPMTPIPLHRYLDRLRRRLRRPTSLVRIVVEAVVLLVLHFVAIKLLADAALLEHLLSPGPGSRAALAVTVIFLL